MKPWCCAMAEPRPLQSRPSPLSPKPQATGHKPQALCKGCMTTCTPHIGSASGFGAQADLLVAQTPSRRSDVENGNRLVIVLNGVNTIDSTVVTQRMLNNFRVEQLAITGIAGA